MKLAYLLSALLVLAVLVLIYFGIITISNGVEIITLVALIVTLYLSFVSNQANLLSSLIDRHFKVYEIASKDKLTSVDKEAIFNHFEALAHFVKTGKISKKDAIDLFKDTSLEIYGVLKDSGRISGNKFKNFGEFVKILSEEPNKDSKTVFLKALVFGAALYLTLVVIGIITLFFLIHFIPNDYIQDKSFWISVSAGIVTGVLVAVLIEVANFVSGKFKKQIKE